jgi:hypothetical protein
MKRPMLSREKVVSSAASGAMTRLPRVVVLVL